MADDIIFEISTPRTLIIERPGGGSGGGITNIAQAGDVTITDLSDGEILVSVSGIFINRTLNEAGISALAHTHLEADITNLQAYLLDLSGLDTGDLSEGSNLYYTDERVDDRVNSLLVAGSNITLAYDDGANTLTISSTGGGGGSSTLEDLTDTTISGPVANDLFQYNGSAWVDRTYAEAGVAEAVHTHPISEITDLQDELDARPVIVSGEFGPAVTFDSLSDVTITTVISGHIPQHNGAVWINRTLAAAGISELLHTHTESDITDLQAYLLDLSTQDTGDLSEGSNLYYTDKRVSDLLVAGTNITLTFDAGLGTLTIDAAGGAGASDLAGLTDTTITGPADLDVLQWNGTVWVDRTLVEAGIAAASHNHSGSDINSGTVADARLSSNVGLLDRAAAWTAAQSFSTFILAGSGGGSTSINSVATAGRVLTVVDSDGAIPVMSEPSPSTGDLMVRLANGSYTSRTLTAGDILTGQFSTLRISAASVTQHEAALDIAWSQLTGVPATFAPAAHNQAASTINSGVFDDARIAESNITQHEAALSITESQISDLAHTVNTDVKTMGIRNTIDGGGSAPTAFTARTFIDQDCTIVSGSILPDVSGSITLVVKRDRSATVTTLGTLTLTTAASLRDTTLTGWTTDLDAGDILIFEWGAGTTLTNATASLGLEAR